MEMYLDKTGRYTQLQIIAARGRCTYIYFYHPSSHAIPPTSFDVMHTYDALDFCITLPAARLFIEPAQG